MICSRAWRSMSATAGSFASSMAATISTWARTEGPMGAAKIVRIAAATHKGLGERLIGQRAALEHGDIDIQIGADP